MKRLITLRQGSVYNSGVEHWECSTGVSKNINSFLPNLKRSLSKMIKGKDWKKPLEFLRAPSLGFREAWKRSVRRQRVFCTLKLNSNPFSRVFAPCSNGRKLEFSGFPQNLPFVFVESQMSWQSYFQVASLACERAHLPNLPSPG